MRAHKGSFRRQGTVNVPRFNLLTQRLGDLQVRTSWTRLWHLAPLFERPLSSIKDAWLQLPTMD